MNPQQPSDAPEFRQRLESVESELRKVIAGQDALLRDVLTALLAGGHVLLEGAPGLGKTLLVRSLASAFDLKFQRIQFTPDLMPADILGTSILIEEPGASAPRFEFAPGPIFCHLLLADEINRATPKTQSALLEAMQERAVTLGGTTRPLESPFFVLATQNPIEMEGTYPLPEAQLDRFFFKLLVPYPGRHAFEDILRRTTGAETPKVSRILDKAGLEDMAAFARAVPVPNLVLERTVELVMATQPADSSAPAEVRRYVRYGASPRAGQALVMASKIRALMEGRWHAATEDVLAYAPQALRHRVLLNYEAQASGVSPDDVIESLCRAMRKRWSL